MGHPPRQLYSEEQLAFCRSLPKVELHAHLNGSIRDATIRFLRTRTCCAQQQGVGQALSEGGSHRERCPPPRHPHAAGAPALQGAGCGQAARRRGRAELGRAGPADAPGQVCAWASGRDSAGERPCGWLAGWRALSAGRALAAGALLSARRQHSLGLVPCEASTTLHHLTIHHTCATLTLTPPSSHPHPG